MKVNTIELIAAAGALLASGAVAETVQWQGADRAAWSAGANWSGGKVPARDDTVVLGDGAAPTVGTETLWERGGVIDDWSVTNAWLLKGDTISKNKGYTENVAYVTNGNVLVLTDDTGGQRNSAHYKLNSVGSNETFEAQFDYRATLLGRHSGESRAEGFSCVFCGHAGQFDWKHPCAAPGDGVYGFLVKIWSDGGFNWVYTNAPSGVIVSGKEMGIDFGQVVHMTVRLAEGILSVKMEQGASVWSASRDISAAFANGNRKYFGFTGGTTDNGKYYAYQTISNFVGRSTAMGGVTRDGYLPFSTTLWKTENRSWPTPLPMVIESESCVMLTNGVGGKGTIGCKKTVPVKEAFTFEFTERLSSVDGWGEGMSISLNPTKNNPTLNGDDLFTCGEEKSISFGHKWWSNCFRWRNMAQGTVTDSAGNPGGMVRAADTDYRWRFSHDGCGGFTARVSCGSVTYTDTQTFADVLDWGENMYLVFGFGAIWNKSIVCRALDPRLGFTYDGPTQVAGTIEVAANATASLAVANLTAGTSGAALTAPVLRLNAGSTLTVSPSTAKGVRATAETVEAAGAATLAAAENAVFELDRVKLSDVLTVTGKWSAKDGAVTLVVPRNRLHAVIPCAMRINRSDCVDAASPTFALVDEDGKAYSAGRRLVVTDDGVYIKLSGVALTLR